MKTIKQSFKLDSDTLNTLNSKQFKRFFYTSKISVFDIETTGLYPKHDKTILIGFVHIIPGKGDGELVQFFAETPEDEKNILFEATREICDSDMLITYNGRSFDMPFLSARCEKHELPCRNIFNLDLYQLVRNYSTLKNVMGSLSQKSMEVFMQIDHLRSDEISGGESVNLYNEYLENATTSFGSEALLHKILLHNKDDVLQLTRLISLLKYLDLYAAVPKIGFTTKHLLVTDYSISSTLFKINGLQIKDFIDYISFPSLEFSGKIEFNAQNGSWQAEYPVFSRKEGKFVDLAEFDGIMTTGENKFFTNSTKNIIDGKLILFEYDKQNSIDCYNFARLFVDKIKDEINQN